MVGVAGRLPFNLGTSRYYAGDDEGKFRDGDLCARFQFSGGFYGHNRSAARAQPAVGRLPPDTDLPCRGFRHPG